MGVSWRTVEWLRAHGRDAPRFSGLTRASGGRFPSVVVFRLSNERPENVNEKLADVLERFGDVLTDGAIVSVRESLVRLRKLPLNG